MTYVNKEQRTCIIVVVIAGLVVISFINPWFWFDDILIYIIIAVVLLVVLSGGDKDGTWERAGRAIGSLRFGWGGTRCPECGARVPYFLRATGKCPACGARDPADLPVGTVQRPRHRQATWGAQGRHTRGPASTKGMEASQANPEDSPFQPPFDELFKDQAGIEMIVTRPVNWEDVHAAVKAWVKAVLTSQETSADQAGDEGKIDAWAKWEAWKSFERSGFEDPTTLPACYAMEVENARRMKQEAEEAEKLKPICPECGASGKLIVPSSLLLVARGKQEYTCKNCGLVFY